MDRAIGSAMVSSSRPMGIVPILFSFKLLIAFFPNHNHAVYIIEEMVMECKQTVKKSAQPKASEGLF